MPVLNRRHVFSHDVVPVSVLVTTHEGWHECGELVSSDSYGPHVHTLAVGLAIDQFRGHPVDRTALGLPMRRLLG